jgi:hypothetical protein
MQVNEAPRKDGGRRRRRRRRRGSGTRTVTGPGGTPIRVDPDDDRLNGAKTLPNPDAADILSPFNLFCAYHLGVTKDNGYKFQSMPEVAKRFNVDVQSLKERLVEFSLETETLRRQGFDSEMGQLDIRVAPEGVSRRELARSMWLELNRPDPDEDVVDDEWDDEYEDDEEEGEEDEPAAAAPAPAPRGRR